MKNKLCLGTVTFGLNYGINNKSGKPSDDVVFDILDLAYKHNIKYLDTASAYGSSELILGAYQDKHRDQNCFNIISKLPPKMEIENSRNIKAEVFKAAEASLKKLNLDKLNGYMLHNSEHLYQLEIMEALYDLKVEGLVDHIGVSIYEPEDAIYAVEKGLVDYIQIPYNVFDQRLDQTDFFKHTKDRDIKVFARSAYLQGLLMMNIDEIPGYLDIAKPYVKRFENIADQYGLDRAKVAVQYVYQNENIDFWVFSVDNVKQLLENIEIINSEPLEEACIDTLKKSFRTIESKILMPNLWR